MSIRFDAKGRVLAEQDATCPGCGERVRRHGLSKHRASQTCIAETAKRSFAERGWTRCGSYTSNAQEARAFGIPVERAATQKSGGRYYAQMWMPRWGEHVLRIKRILLAPSEEVLRAFVKKVVADPAIEAAFRVVCDQLPQLDGEAANMVMPFAKAVLTGDEKADAELQAATDTLIGVLRSRAEWDAYRQRETG